MRGGRWLGVTGVTLGIVDLGLLLYWRRQARKQRQVGKSLERQLEVYLRRK